MTDNEAVDVSQLKVIDVYDYPHCQNITYESLSEKDELLGGNFFEIETFQNPELGKKIIYGLIADQATENFLQREDQSFLLSEEQFYKVFNDTIVQVSVDSLKQKGLVVIFEDENGEECIALSEKGKKIMEDMGW
jgi:hypothetical protein